MFGFVYSSFVVFSRIVDGIKKDVYNFKARNKAARYSEQFYYDLEMRKRSVDTNHKICWRTTDINGDKVDLDLNTGKPIRNYSKEKRNSIEIKKKEIENLNNRNRLSAINNNSLYYTKTFISNNGASECKLCFVNNDRPVTPNKLMDLETDMYICGYGSNDPIKAKENAIKSNWVRIKSDWSKIRKNRTEYEAIKYAKGIGALL